jgi:hypothetical protein
MKHGFRWWLACYCMRRFVLAGCRLRGFWYHAYKAAWWMVYPRRRQREFARQYHREVLDHLDGWRGVRDTINK